MNIGNWGNWIGQIADDVTHQIEGGLQNVDQIVRATLTNPGFAAGPYFQTSGGNYVGDKHPGQGSDPSGTSYYMGNGGVSGSPTSPTAGPSASSGAAPRFCQTSSAADDEAMDINQAADQPSSKSSSARICDHCSSKFSLFNRKKVCSECRDHFCSNCIVTSTSRSSRRLCVCCNILLKRPLVRSDLMSLRVKDLQKHLIRKKINSKSCVEKKDLVELIIRESLNNAEAAFTSSSTPTSPTSGDDRSSSRHPPGPIERQSSFPKAYVESNHRREWFEKLDRASENTNDVTDPAEVAENVRPEDQVVPLEPARNTSPEPSAPPVELTPVEPIIDENRESRPTSPEVSNESELTPPEVAADSGGGARDEGGAVGGAAPDNHLKPTSEPKNIPSDLTGSLSAASSPSRRFARQGLVRLNEIETVEDLHELSAKQCKDLLALNRVNFHGVIEKEELLKILERLWKQEKKAQEEKDTMEDQDLCKICWDAAVDCVMLECGHMATCTKCGKQLAECPICRQYVVRVVRTFKA